MRLIDADALKETLATYIAEYMRNPGKNMSRFLVGVLDKVDDSPTIGVKQMACEIMRYCERQANCFDCEFHCRTDGYICAISDSDDQYGPAPMDWKIKEDGDPHDSGQ